MKDDRKAMNMNKHTNIHIHIIVHIRARNAYARIYKEKEK